MINSRICRSGHDCPLCRSYAVRNAAKNKYHRTYFCQVAQTQYHTLHTPLDFIWEKFFARSVQQPATITRLNLTARIDIHILG